jgi:hypothetical protein
MSKLDLIGRTLIILIIFVLISLYCPLDETLAATYFVGKSGCSNSYPGTQSQPRCSISSGISLLSSGDTLKIMAGTYVETISITKSYVTVSGNKDGEVIIDGNNTLPSGSGRTYSPLVTVTGTSSILRDVTVANSRGEGIEVTGTSAQLINVFVHHSGENGIILKANYSICDGCRSWSNAMSNQGGTQSVGWGTGISACRHPQHAVIRNSSAWDNWGEGISTFEAEYTTLEDNVSYNNWSLQMYLSDTTNTIAQRNLLYVTPNNPTAGQHGGQYGLGLGDEVSNPASSDNKVLNNFVMGTNRAFYPWDSQKNLIVANNTFVNANGGSTIELSGGINSIFENNIIVQDDSRSIGPGTTSGFTFSHNLWSKTPSTKGASDLIGNPQLARTGTIGAGTLQPQWFMLTSASILAIDKGVTEPSISVDYFKTNRFIGSAPDIGGHEYGIIVTTTPLPTVTPSPLPTMTPTSTPLVGDINTDKVVNLLDYTLLSNAFGTNNTAADLNTDHTINLLDYTILSNNFGKRI